MSDPSARTFSSDFKRFFLRGLVVLLPSILTLWIVVEAYQFVDRTVAEPINRNTRTAMKNWSPGWLQEQFNPTEAEFNQELTAAMKDIAAKEPRVPMTDALQAQLRDEVTTRLRNQNIDAWWARHWYMNLIGLVLAVVGVYVAGRLLGGFIGWRIYRSIERVIVTLPVFKQVYPYVKQVVDFLFSDDRQVKFNRVVAVEYPRKGSWSVGFLTSGAMQTVAERANAVEKSGELVTVFVPCSPTPFTGYAISVPRGEVLELPMTVDEAVRFIVSCGVLVPQHLLAGQTGMPTKHLTTNQPGPEAAADRKREPELAASVPKPHR
ncbi:MAG: DUF502 domain-containing protein [Phycisphaerales bacterium]|nr:DUF502 domain-containing protein [Phycisphaerales bacterium]MCI0631023.1 DUF502 domain-containing protein [Phycisphaerales bacterium]MCI0676228.1 DUF502 domain-containing protein [Phycisphaerales bacterium]